jgi:hypothetical protein
MTGSLRRRQREAGRRQGRRRLRGLAVLGVFTASAVAALSTSGAFADGTPCSGGSLSKYSSCVMLIQVDGLEPKDVTPQTTPFLWALAHPGSTAYPESAAYSQQLTGRAGFIYQAARGVMMSDTVANTTSLLTGGYPEQTGIPSNDYYSAQHDSTTGLFSYNGDEEHRYGVIDGSVDSPESVAAPDSNDLGASGFQTLFEMTHAGGNATAAFVGDPLLGQLINIHGDDVDYSWLPAPYADPSSPSATPPPAPSPDNPPPIFCPVPRDPGVVQGGGTPDNPPGPQHTEAAQGGCVAPDNQVLNGPANNTDKGSAFNVLKAASTSTTKPYPAFTYIELGEVGAVKRYTADLDGPPSPDPNAPKSSAPMTVPEALHEMDASLALFFSHLGSPDPTAGQALNDAFKSTIVMVVGDHGYEQTLPDKRVPDPNSIDDNGVPKVADPTTSTDADADAPSKDLAYFVSHFDPLKPNDFSDGGGPFKLAVQGTMATVYCNPSSNVCPTVDQNGSQNYTVPAAYRDALKALRDHLLGDVDAKCKILKTAQTNGTDTGCIQEVLYTRPQLAPSDSPEDLGNVLGGASIPFHGAGSDRPGAHNCDFTVPVDDPDFANEGTLQNPDRPGCSTWHLDHNGFNGDNEAVHPSGISGDLVIELKPGWSAGRLVPSTSGVTSGDPDAITNPYLASDGSPRDRPIAVVIDGPSNIVQKLDPATGTADSSWGGRYPVLKDNPKGADGSDPDAFDPSCPTPDKLAHDQVRFPTNGQTDDGVIQANWPSGSAEDAATAQASLDDADAPGYICQAETVDFAPTIASLLGVNMPSNQIQGRLLREAFSAALPESASGPTQPPTTFFAEPFGPISPKDPTQPEPLWASHSATFGFWSDQPSPPGSKFWCRFDSNRETDWYRCGQKATEVNTKIGQSRTEALGSSASAALAATCSNGQSGAAKQVFRCNWPAAPKVGVPLSIGEHTFEVCAEGRTKHPRFDPTDRSTWRKPGIVANDPSTWPQDPTDPKTGWMVHKKDGDPSSPFIDLGFDPNCGEQTSTHFRVIPFFDFDGLLQNLGAFITDKKGHPVKQSQMLLDRHGFLETVRSPAAHRAKLDHLDVRADFGRPFSSVQLSLYRKLRKPAGGCSGKGKCQLNTLAKFPPFTITRGPVDLLFGIPKHFSGIRTPTHVGISVQELRLLNPGHRSGCLKDPSRMVGPRTSRHPYCLFEPIGQRTGNIVPIQDFNRLHHRNG